jgi:hypothetical protein
VRLTIVLAERLQGEAADHARSRREAEASARRAAEERARAEAEDRLWDRRESVSDAVERLLEAEGADHDEIDEAVCELNDRLDEMDEAELFARPLAELVEEACRELGVDFDPALWMDEAAQGEPGAATGSKVEGSAPDLDGPRSLPAGALNGPDTS